jgi:hypothetical protein
MSQRNAQFLEAHFREELASAALRFPGIMVKAAARKGLLYPRVTARGITFLSILIVLLSQLASIAAGLPPAS